MSIASPKERAQSALQVAEGARVLGRLLPGLALQSLLRVVLAWGVCRSGGRGRAGAFFICS